MLELLYDDHSTLRAVNLASRCGKVDIYVDHGIQEAEVVPNLFLPSSIPECDDDDCEIDAEPIDETDVEENIEHFLSNDDEEVREVRRIGKQQIEEDDDGAENTNNDEDKQQAGGDSGFEDIPQVAQSGGDSGCEDRAAFCEDYDSDDPPSYETCSEDNVNDVGDHSTKQGNELGHDGVVSNGVEGTRLAE
nr:hypothetical protein Itr_chr12CG17290 [Ipomoea trifida]